MKRLLVVLLALLAAGNANAQTRTNCTAKDITNGTVMNCTTTESGSGLPKTPSSPASSSSPPIIYAPAPVNVPPLATPPPLNIPPPPDFEASNRRNAEAGSALVVLGVLAYKAVSAIRQSYLERESLAEQKRLRQVDFDRQQRRNGADATALSALGDFDWTLVARLPDGTEMLRANATVTINENIRSALVRVVYPRADTYKDSNGHFYHNVISRMIVNCKEWAFAVQSQVREFYDSRTETYFVEAGKLAWSDLPPRPAGKVPGQLQPGLCSLGDHPVLPDRDTSRSAAVSPTPLTSNVSLNLAAGWQSNPVPQNLAKSGVSLYTINRNIDAGAILSSTAHEGITDMVAYAETRRARVAGSLTAAVASEIAQVDIGGRHAFRFAVTGQANTGQSFTYLVTVIEGAKDIAVLNTWTFAANYEQRKDELGRLSESVVGL